MESEEFTLAPIAGWETRLIAPIGAAAVTFQYLVSPMETPDQAHRSPNYLMTATQLRELANALLQAADRVVASGTQGAGLPRH